MLPYLWHLRVNGKVLLFLFPTEVVTMKEKKNDGLVDTIQGAASSEVVSRYGDAASEYIKGYKGIVDADGNVISKGLKQIAEGKVNPDFEYANLKQQAGFSAEVHYVNKRNAENIINKDHTRYSRSNDVGLGNDPKVDILAIGPDGKPVVVNGEPLWAAQMKFCGKYDASEEIKQSSRELANRLAGDGWDKYRGNKVLVPSEQYDHIKKYAHEEAQKLYQKAEEFRKQGNLEKAELLEKKANAFDQVSKDVTDSGISSKEAMFLREHAGLATAKYVAETAHRAGIEQAKAGAVISGTISVSQNILCVIQGDKEIKEALTDTAIDTAKGAGTSYIIAASGSAVKSLMKTSESEIFVNLSQTNLPAMIATVTVQVSKSLIRYAKGEIDELELVEELGEKGTGMMAASMGAAIGTAVFPGIGTVVGGMIGYMTSSSIYKSATTVLKEERLSEEKRAKMSAITQAALEALRRQQEELEELIYEFYSHRDESFKASFEIINKAIDTNDIDSLSVGLNKIALEFGRALRFKNFKEFDEFMVDEKSILVF